MLHVESIHNPILNFKRTLANKTLEWQKKSNSNPTNSSISYSTSPRPSPTGEGEGHTNVGHELHQYFASEVHEFDW